MRNKKAQARDMVISLAVILLPMVAIYYLFSDIPDEPQVEAVVWQPVVEQARKDAAFTVLAPTSLPDTWKPVRARYLGDENQLGFLNPDQVYFEVKQRLGATNPSFVSDITREGVEEGTSTVGKRTWTRYVSGDERSHCLVNVIDGKQKPTTTVVCGDTGYEGVEAFASTLA